MGGALFRPKLTRVESRTLRRQIINIQLQVQNAWRDYHRRLPFSCSYPASQNTCNYLLTIQCPHSVKVYQGSGDHRLTRECTRGETRATACVTLYSPAMSHSSQITTDQASLCEFDHWQSVRVTYFCLQYYGKMGILRFCIQLLSESNPTASLTLVYVRQLHS